MKTKMKLLVCLTVLSLIASLFVGCAAGSKSADRVITPGDSNASAGGMGNAPTEGIKPDGGSIGEYDRKIIRTVTMSCESKAFDDAITVILTALEAQGGYVESSSSSGTAARSVASTESYRQARFANYVLRVPAEKLDAFLNTLRVDEGIRILSQKMSSNEITSSYYDAKTRLETLNAEKNSLTAMLESFTEYADISDMLAVQERLYNVIEEMEALQTKLNLYDSQVAMSTVNLSLTEVVEYTVVDEAEPTFGARVSEAFVNSWTSFGKGCQNFAVWFVSALPVLVVLTVLGLTTMFILLGVRKRCRRRNQAGQRDNFDNNT